MATAGPHPTLVGRESELSELGSRLGIRPAGDEAVGDHAAERAPGEQPPTVVLLAGDAGVGKTRLLTELRDLAFAGGWQVVAGHCLDFGDSALPYLPFSEVVSRLAADLPTVVEEIAELHPGLARLQPGRRVLGGDASETSAVDRGDLFSAVHAVLAAAAATAPLLLVIEDAHWADRSTRDLLSFLFARPFAARVAIVVSYRAEDLHRRHPLRPAVAEWARVHGVERLQLDPLNEIAVRRLVRELHPDPLSEPEVADIVRRAEGNAFFVEELLGAGTGGAALPEDLADVLLVRLEQLDDVTRRVVRAMAVAGRRVSHGLLAQASGVPEADLDRALRTAVESHVVVTSRDDRYSFRHALLAEAVYDDLLPGERVRLHAAYADALREGAGPGTAAELARHARAAMDLATALDASVRAGDEAMAVGGPDEAARHYEHALELAADPRLAAAVDLPRLVVSASDALVNAGAPQRAASLVQRHLEQVVSTDPATTAQLHLQFAWAASVYDNEHDWREHADRGRELIPAAAGPMRARLLALYARVTAAHGQAEARQAAVEALRLAEQHNLPKVAADAATTVIGLDRDAEIPIEQLTAALEDAAHRAGRTGAVNSEVRALFFLGRGHQDRGDLDAAVAAFTRAVARSREVGRSWAPYALDSRFMLGQVHWTAGRWQDVLAATDVDGQSPPAIGEAMLTALRSLVQAARGEELAGTFARLRRYWHKEGMVALIAGPVEIECLGRAGDPDGVIRVTDELVGLLAQVWRERFHARVRISATALGALACAAGELTAEQRARFAADGERLYADGRRTLDFQAQAGTHWGPEGRAWASRLDAEWLRLRRLLDTDPPTSGELVTAWQQAERRFAELGHRSELPVVQVRLAEALRAAGDVSASREVAARAREAAVALGAVTVLAELRGLGAPPRGDRGPATEAALTPRETEILGLVAQGRSNGEIGRQLFISTKTVSVHVSNILGKLGAATRTEAAAVARRRGLLG